MRHRWPVLVVGGAVVAVAAAAMVHAVYLTGGFAYPLDDTYIHMGLARRFVQTGTWGVEPGVFVSATSAPLWTAILAVLYLPGAWDAAPLVLNALAVLATLACADRMLRRESAGVRLAGLGLVAFLTPLDILALTGMEHTLHAAVTLAFAGMALRAWQRALSPGEGLATLLLAAALPMIRYEGLLLIGPAVVGLVWARRWRLAIGVAVAAAASVGGYAAVSVALGGYVVPNSLLVKSALKAGVLANVTQNVGWGVHVWLLVLVAVAVRWLGPRDRVVDAHTSWFAVVAVAHLAVGTVGWFYRYESYLLAWGAVVLTLSVRPALARRRGPAVAALVVLGGALAITGGRRTVAAHVALWKQVMFNHDGRVLVAKEVAATWPDAVVALHDIGAFTYFTDIDFLDIDGLASDDACALTIEGRLSPDAIAELASARGVDVAIVARSWFTTRSVRLHLPTAERSPRAWRPVGQIRHLHGVGGQRPSYTVYAAAPEAEPRVAALVADLRVALPARVVVDRLGGVSGDPPAPAHPRPRDGQKRGKHQ